MDIPNAARKVILDVGYDRGAFNGKNCTIMTNLSEMADGIQHAHITSIDNGALDQLVAQDNVTLFGYACTHTPALQPLPIWLAHRMV